MTVIGHILGFPRIGLYRELKYSLEQYWNGVIDQDKLLSIGRMLRMRHWKQQINAGLDFISVGDFAWYDHVLTMSAMIDNIPSRHRLESTRTAVTMIDILFNVARGYTIGDNIILPSEMKKWFNTNYHYIVPEFTQNQKFKLNWMQIFDEIDEALSFNHAVKPVLIGPITYLWIGKVKGEIFDRLSLLPSLLSVYQEILDVLSKKNINWVQIDEPALVLELPKKWTEAYLKTYQKLYFNNKIKLLLTTYFDGINHQLNMIKQFKIDGLHVDLISSSADVLTLHQQLPKNWVLSVGVINGRNIWKTNLYYWFDKLDLIKKHRTLWIGSSCSLLHVPIDLNVETKLDNNIKDWFAFALQKCSEIKMLCDALNILDQNNYASNIRLLKEYYYVNENRINSHLVNNFQVQDRCRNIISNDISIYSRKTPHSIRLTLQRNKFCLPKYPTTTIGSFPQTKEIRRLRLKFKNNQINRDQYQLSIKKYIKTIIEEQEKLGLDVLVHGEPERNDMVEYFSEHLNGFSFTQNGWVQSYGSRCVKPPIIIGDVSRPQSITKEWILYAQSLTKKPVKGILTGPITIMSWSFLREDIQRCTIALQIALSIKDEVLDLERSGINIIQIDEPALREGLPLKISEQKIYLKWSINAFKMTVSSVQDDTQIHTHMCYSEFNEIIRDLLRLDADVVSIEASRSDMKLLKSIQNELNNLNEIGLGVYDIHSMNIPTVIDLVNKLNQFLKYIPQDRLWINPDCGLKTRSWNEIKNSLNNMVIAAKILRNQ